MTIKNQDKIVSEENQDVVTDATFSNGILTLIRKNLYDESTSAQKNIEVDLSDHKLKLKVLQDETELRTLEESDDENDIKEKQSYVFLVPFESGEEGIYREYIWIEDESDANGGEFEVIGSTRADLEPYLTTELAASTYVAKETGKGLSSNDYTTAEKNKLANLATVATSGSYNDLTNKPTIPDISGKENVSNKVTTISSSSTDDEYPTALTVYNALQIIQVSTQELISYADEQGILNTYTIGSGTKDQFYNDVKNYIINNWGVSSSDYDFGIFVTEFAADTRNYQMPNDILLVCYCDELWDNKETVYIYNHANFIVKKIGTDTKTLTVTYTDNTTEDIEFYVR